MIVRPCGARGAGARRPRRGVGGFAWGGGGNDGGAPQKDGDFMDVDSMMEECATNSDGDVQDKAHTNNYNEDASTRVTAATSYNSTKSIQPNCHQFS